MSKQRISKFMILPISVLFLILNSEIFAGETSEKPIQMNKKWAGESQSKEELMNIHSYKASPPEVTNQFHVLRYPFSKGFDVNGQIEESMAWDKDIHFSKSSDDKIQVSVGIVKIKQVLCGAVLRVPLFR